MIKKDHISLSEVVSQIGSFINYWDNLHNASANISLELEVQTFLFHLSTKNQLPHSIEELKLKLRPFICKNFEQQETFNQSFEDWLNLLSSSYIAKESMDDISNHSTSLAYFIIPALIVLIGIAIYTFQLFQPIITPILTPYRLHFKNLQSANKDESCADLFINYTDTLEYFYFEIAFTQGSLSRNPVLYNIEGEIKVADFSNFIVVKSKNINLIPEQTPNDSLLLTTICFNKSAIINNTRLSFTDSIEFRKNAILVVPNRIKFENIILNTSDDEAGLSSYMVWISIITSIFFFWLAYLIINILQNRKDQFFLNRRLEKTNENFRVKEIFAISPNEFFSFNESSKTREFIKKIPFLNQKLETTTLDLSLVRTIKATIKNAGLVTPDFETRKKRPEYTILVDKKSKTDLQAQYITQIFTFFEQYNIDFKLYYFNQDIRYCSRPDSEKAIKIEEVHKHSPDDILLIFSSLNAFVGPRGINKEYQEILKKWKYKKLFTPENLKPFHKKHQSFSLIGLTPYSYSVEGLSIFISDFFQNEVPKRSNDLSHFLPNILAGSSHKWIDRYPPSEEEENYLILELKRFLGSRGFFWLQSLAIFPEVKNKLTSFLGRKLTNTFQEPVFHPEVYKRLMRLPWLRNSYIPDWLRERLISSLNEKEKTKTINVIKQFFVSSKDKEGVSYSEYAITENTNIENIIDRVFKLLYQQSHPDSLLKERIFSSFMKGSLTYENPNISKPSVSENILTFDLTNTVQKLSMYAMLFVIYSGVIMITFLTFGLFLIAIYSPQIFESNKELKTIKQKLESIEKNEGSDIELMEPASDKTTLNKEEKAIAQEETILGYATSFYILFFIEMWERFSYYGMRAILVLFLMSSILDGGWGWTTGEALALYGTYTALVYLTPILGGWLSDYKLGYYRTILTGGILLVIGYFCVALEITVLFYLGLFALILGGGLFKPNVSAYISKMYKNRPQEQDSVFSIFYMGVNAGAFIGIMLCGYLGEKLGFRYGFGLASIFMFLGLLQFWFARSLLTEIGNPLSKLKTTNKVQEVSSVPFTTTDIILFSVFGVSVSLYIIGDPLYKIGNIDLFSFGSFGNFENINGIIILLSIGILFISRLVRFRPIEREKMIALSIFAFCTILFWAVFEQGGSTMIIFLRDYTGRVLLGNEVLIFNIIDTFVTIIPLILLTYILIKFVSTTFQKIPLSNIILTSLFCLIWGLVIWKVQREYYSDATAEIPVTWFSILNSLFVIMLTPFFIKWWKSKYNPSATSKNGIGLISLGLGFAFLFFGASSIEPGARFASMSVFWIVGAYLFHTIGELFISPTNLANVSKLVPGRMIAIMFSFWYLGIAIGNKLFGQLGGFIESITSEYSISTLFLIFTFISFALGIIIIALNPLIKRLMHGVE